MSETVEVEITTVLSLKNADVVRVIEQFFDNNAPGWARSSLDMLGSRSPVGNLYDSKDLLALYRNKHLISWWRVLAIMDDMGILPVEFFNTEGDPLVFPTDRDVHDPVWWSRLLQVPIRPRPLHVVLGEYFESQENRS
jgi:hypothetical protein